MHCTVSYALPERQWLWSVELPPRADVATALAAVAAQLTGSDALLVDAAQWNSAVVGVFGRVCERTQSLSEGDRVEIYRPLAADPKESRRDRVRRLKKAGK